MPRKLDNDATFRKCSKCGVWKQLSHENYAMNYDKFRTICKECHNKYTVEHKKKKDEELKTVAIKNLKECGLFENMPEKTEEKPSNPKSKLEARIEKLLDFLGI